MSLPYGTVDMETPQRTRFDRWFPFWNEGDSLTEMVEEEFVVLAESYQPRPLGAGHFTVPNAILVEEKRPERLDGGLYKFVRLYSHVPQARISYEPYGYQTLRTSSGSAQVLVTNSPFSVIDGAQYVNYYNGSTQYGTKIVFNAGDLPHNFSVGDTARFRVEYTTIAMISSQPVAFTSYGYVSKTVHATDAGSITVPLISDDDLYTGAFGLTITAVYQGVTVVSTSYLRTVSSRIIRTYHATSNPADIQVLQPFVALDANNEQTTTLSATTVPTAAAFEAMVANGTELIVSPSSIRRWRGTIWERSTRYVVALL